MINKSEKKTDKTELDIDIIAVIQFLWSKRKLFLKSSGIAVIIGLVIAFSIPKEYTTTVKLMPETNNTASKMGIIEQRHFQRFLLIRYFLREKFQKKRSTVNNIRINFG